MSRKLTLTLTALAAVAAFVSFRKEPPAAHPPARDGNRDVDPPAAPAVPAPIRGAVSLNAMDVLLSEFPALEPEQRVEAIRRCIHQLLEAGPKGLEVVVAFLRSGKDVPIREGYRMEGLRMVEAPTLRIALIEALRDWEGSTPVLLDFLKSPAPIWELVLAARNLELQYPGTYRDPALAAIKASLARPGPPGFGDGGEAHLFATARHFKASEILPELARVTAETRGPNVPRYLQLLETFPRETRTAATERLFSNPEIADEIEFAPQTLNQWPYGDPGVQAFVSGVFASRLNVQQQVAMLDGLEATAPALQQDESLFGSKETARAREQAAAKSALAEAQARKAFLASLAKTPGQAAEVQAAIKDAQNRVTDEIALRQTAERAESKPLVEVPIGFGDGSAQIKGRRIEQLNFRPAAGVILPDENSTEGSDR